MSYQEGSIVETDKGTFTLKDSKWVPYNIPKPPGGTPLSDMSISERMNNVIGDIPRAAGVAGRNVIEGIGETVDFLGSPIRAGMSLMGMQDPAGGGKMLADSLGLPEPATPTERVVSQAEKVLVGGGGLFGLASKGSQAAKAGTVAQQVAKSMTKRPDLQVASMVGSGVAGGGSKEAGGGWGTQLASSIIGGVGAPLAVSGGKNIVHSLKSAYKALTKDPTNNNKINSLIDAALKDKGVKAGDISELAKMQMREDMAKALKQGELSPEAVSRLIDYRVTGATPTAAGVTLDPGVITKQKNLQAIGANSSNPKMQELSQTANANAKKLSDNLNNLGADMSDDAYTAGQKIINSLDEVATGETNNINSLYKQARATTGRSANLDPSSFTQKASDLLDQNMVGGKLPSDVRNTLNKIAKGEMPFTVDIAEQLKTNMGKLGRSATDGQEKMALGLVRQALDDTPLMGGQGKEAIQAFNAARKANFNWMTKVDETPALKAVVNGVEPDKFVKDFILANNKNATVNGLKNLKKIIGNNKEALDTIKGYIVKHLKGKLTGESVDDGLAKLNAATYNKALNAIGNNKLKVFFDGDEITKLKSVGKVASYEQAQPVGSAVNNSNTANSLTAGALDLISGNSLVRNIPLMANPLKGISNNINAKGMMDVRGSLLQQKPKVNPVAPFAIPGLLGISSINSGKN